MKIMEDKPLDGPAHWCWRPQWLTGYDSAFGLLMKFAYLNALTARELAPLFVTRTRGKRTALLKALNVDLRDADCFDREAMAQIFGADQGTMRNVFVFERFPDRGDSSGTLRWCEQCLSWGLHLSIWQLTIANHCPIHGQPLRNTCFQCLASIPYRLTPAVFANPFCCPECGRDLAPCLHMARSQVLAPRIEECTRIGLMTRQLECHTQMGRRTVKVPTDLGAVSGLAVPRVDAEELEQYIGFIGEVVSRIATHQQQRALELVRLAQASCGCGGSGESLHEHFGRSAETSYFGTDAELAVLVGVYRTAKRKLWRDHVAQHEPCVRMACGHFWWNLRGTTTSAICPVAAAFIRWRMLWEGCGTPRYLDAKQKRHYFGILGWLQARPAPYPDRWAADRKAWMLSHIFYSVAMASFDEILKDVERAFPFDRLSWSANTSAPHALTHWALVAEGEFDRAPQLYTPGRATSRVSGPERSASNRHTAWQRAQLDRISH